MYYIQVHVPYEKQQYIKKMNHYITTYPLVVITWFRRSICLEFAVCQSTKAPHAVRVQNSAQDILL